MAQTTRLRIHKDTLETLRRTAATQRRTLSAQASYILDAWAHTQAPAVIDRGAVDVGYPPGHDPALAEALHRRNGH
jgi:hypothetical protein